MSGFGGTLDLSGLQGALARRGPGVALALLLYIAGGIHFVVGFEHATPGSFFGLLAIAAGALQWILGIAVFLAPSRSLYLAASLASLVLVELYVLNVTVGLPPLIAHVHTTGTHILFGYPLSLPNQIETLGLGAIAAEIGAVFCATLADRTA